MPDQIIVHAGNHPRVQGPARAHWPWAEAPGPKSERRTTNAGGPNPTMRVRVAYRTPDMAVDETFSGNTAEAVVVAMQKAIAGRLGFALRLFVNAMSPTQFAQEVVRRYNEATGRAIPSPASCEEFIRSGEAEGIVSILER